MNNSSTLILAIALIFTMWGMGLSLNTGDFKRVFKHPKAVLIGLLNQLLLLPVIGFTLLKLIPTSPEVAVGIMILSACPGGPTSNLLSLLAKADTALSVSLTAITSVLTIFTIPIIVNIGLENFAGEGQTIRMDIAKTVGQMFVVVIFPMTIGMFIRYKNAPFADKMGKPVRLLSAILLALIIVGIIVKEKNNILGYFADAGLIAILLNVSTMSLGLIAGYLAKLSPKQSATISIESGIQNGTMALAIAGTLLQNTAYGIAPAVYSLLMYITGGLLVVLFLKRNNST